MKKNTNYVNLFFAFIFCCQSAFAWRAGFDQQSFPGTFRQAGSAGIQSKAICMAGYDMLCKRTATGVHDPVGVQALFLTDEQNGSLLFISLDAVGFGQVLAKNIRQLIAAETRLAEENIILSATHTHSSLDLQGLWGSISREQQQAIIEIIADAGRNAWMNLEKVSLHASTTNTLKGFNRRTKNDDIVTQILAIQLRNEQGSPFATLFTLGSHPVILDRDNTLLTSDWVHYARSSLNRSFNAPVIFINGVLGDVLPGDGNPRTFSYAETYGTEIASDVVKSLTKSRQLTSSLSYCTERLEDKADNLSLIFAAKALRNGTVDWKHFFSTSFHTQTSVIVLDDIVLLTTPGEPVTAQGRALMGLVQNNPVAVLGLTHDTLGYLIPEDSLMEKGYEENVMISHTITGKVTESLQKLVNECLPRQP